MILYLNWNLFGFDASNEQYFLTWLGSFTIQCCSWNFQSLSCCNQSRWRRIMKKNHTFNNCCEAFFCLSSSFECKERHQVCCARTVDLFFCPTTAMSPTLSVLSRRIGTVSEEAEFPSAGQRVKISQSIRVRLPAAAETSRESIWFFSEKNKLCRAYFKKK